ncbi:unnamed protein product [Sphagnum troendelagicum]|uniref:Uncharacterized protein n=1 Tax=Sphagnum troendelagicum TaxID=128251 RepID=A0ABP0TUZ9_9BRYO
MRVHNEGAEEEEDLFQWDRDQVDVKHRAKSGKSVKASLRFFESATVDLHGDRDLEWSLEDVQLACVNRTEQSSWHLSVMNTGSQTLAS